MAFPLRSFWSSVPGYLELDGGVFSGGRSFDITLAFRTDQLNAILLFTYSHQADDFMLVNSAHAHACTHAHVESMQTKSAYIY